MKNRIFAAILTIAVIMSTVFVYSPNYAFAASTDLSGKYWIGNAQVTGVFVDVADSTNGKAVQTHSATTARNQTWTLELISGGYYKIKSNLSGYYLTVDGNSSQSGASVSVATYTGASGQQWSVNEDDYGYEIRAKCSDYLLSAPVRSRTDADLPQNGTTLGMYMESFDGYNQEYWYLYKVSGYNLSINADYDDSYVERYGTTVSSRIDDMLLWLKTRMIIYAGINVSFNVNYDNVDTYLDTGSSSCAAHNSKTTMCNCGTCINSTSTALKSYHHTNYYNILYRLTNPTQSTSIRVVFSGHDMCEIRNSTHVASTTAGYTFSAARKDKDIILMFDFYTDTFDHERMIFIKNIFEFYGLTDHTDISQSGYSDKCLFGGESHNSDIVEMCTLCDHCKQLLKTNINRYNHSNG